MILTAPFISAKQFVEDHKLVITAATTATVTLILAQNLKVQGAADAVAYAIKQRDVDAELFRSFLVKTDQIDEFNAFLPPYL